MRIAFSREPRGGHYKQLIDFCARHCDRASLVIREIDWLEPGALDVLDRLRMFQVSVEERSEWPGTRLIGHTATVYTYAAQSALIGILKDAVTGLYEWVQPRRPEDLSFYRPDGAPFLSSISHEKDAYLDLTSEEFQILQQTCLHSIIVQDIGFSDPRASKR